MSVAKRTCLLLAVPLLAGCETPAGGRWPQRGTADPEKAKSAAMVMTSPNLRLEALVERDGYLLGEPVYLALRLENVGTEAQRVFGSLDPSDGAVEILVRAGGGREQRFVPLVEADHDESIMVEFSPGQLLGALPPVFFGGNGWTFPSPGAYSVTAIYHTPARDGRVLEARSIPLTIQVRQTPDGSGEFLVGSTAAALEAGKFLTWQAGDHLTAGRQHLENLLQRYPRSELTHYAHSALSRSYGRQFSDYRTRQVRPPNCDLALGHLQQVADERLPRFVRMQNALTRARCAARAQDNAAARAALTQARGIAGELPELRSMVAQVEDLERGLGGPGPRR